MTITAPADHEAVLTPVLSAADARDLWLAELELGGCSPRTTANYRAITTEALRAIAHRHDAAPTELLLTDITRDDVVAALAAYQARPDGRNGGQVRRSPRSLVTFYRGLRSFFSWAVETEKLGANPARGMKPPKAPKSVPKAMSSEACADLLAAATASRTPERDRLALLLGMGMGLRLAEMVSLETSSFVPSPAAPERVRVVGKGSKERVVPVPAAVASALAAYLPVRAAELEATSTRASTLFLAGRTTAGRRDVSRPGLSAVFERLVQAAGLKERGRRVHATRHSFATHVLHAGADILSVSELLGHASVATTQIYLAVDQDRLTAAVEANPLLG